jgi:hypothetical protein
VARQNVKKLLPLLDEKAELLPVVRIALHTTHLLLNPCWGSAWYATPLSFLARISSSLLSAFNITSPFLLFLYAN